MSIIFGIFNRNNKAIESSTIQLLNNALSYWESDDSGIWKEGPVALGHRMLWNTPESKQEHLPHIANLDNQLFVITIDARLDNRETLAEHLGMTTLPLGKITDSDLILAAYEKWGKACPEYLLGDFVFAIWDAKKERVFCARDHIGIKPFYYHLSDDLFVFSNDIRGLCPHPKISNKYNDRSIAMFLGGDCGFYDERDTFFDDIQKLPAATTLTISKDGASESSYWDIQNIKEIHYNTFEEYVEKLRELICDAVKVRLRTVYPAASHLSGGIDSSSIAVLAARELEKRKQPLYAFNWVETPDEEHDPDYPEWGFASQIASLENIEQINVRLSTEYIEKMYNKVNITKDDITYYLREYLVRDAAEKYKTRTILSGWGGDELISYNGYAYLSGLFRQGHFMKAIKEISVLYEGKKYKNLRMIKRSLRELIYPFFYRQMPGLYQKTTTECDPYELTRDQFASFAREQTFEDPVFKPGVHNEQKLLFTDGHIVRRIENWASSAFEKKLEYSYPLLDKRIVEFAFAVPEDLFAWKGGHHRIFFRSAVSKFLPKNIAWAAKLDERLHSEKMTESWHDSLKLWMKKHENLNESDFDNNYVDFAKIMNRLKTYYSQEQNCHQENNILLTSRILASIFLLNLKKEQLTFSGHRTSGNVS